MRNLDFPNAENWHTFESVAQITGIPTRTLRRRLESVPGNHVREAVVGRGRPLKLYHRESLPELAIRSSADAASEAKQAAPRPRGASATEVALAGLRLTAVREYQTACRSMPESEAAAYVRRAWATGGPSVPVPHSERLPSGYIRRTNNEVSLGDFSVSTLRRWDRLYREGHSTVLSLVPRRAGRCGRKATDVSPELLQKLWAVSGSTARADVVKAVGYMKHTTQNFPALSISTWRRRLLKLDPRKFNKSLSHSIARFRQEHSPDVEIDWTQLAYNDRWEVDDCTLDYYGLAASDPKRAMRPKAYRIFRAATRQWVAFVTSEADITQDQLRGLIGAAMASAGGGIPKLIKFEHGTVATDPYLEWLLGLLGVNISRSSMDSGHVYPGALPDIGRGNPKSKALLESNNRRAHNLGWLIPTQVGGEERHTASSRLLRVLSGDPTGLIKIPSAQEWHSIERGIIEQANTTPHSGLPMVFDPTTNTTRHMSPNERAAELATGENRVMAPEYLTLFVQKGIEVPVTRNGIMVNGRSYGRFDEQLLANRRVTVHVDPLSPDTCYVLELGRCVDLYNKESVDGTDQFGRKRHIEQTQRNKYESAMASMLASGQDGISYVDQVQITNNPAASRPTILVTNDTLAERSNGLREAIAARGRLVSARDSRWSDPSAASEAKPASLPVRRGALSRGAEIKEQLEVLAGVAAGGQSDEEKWSV
jgi:hypothetical protein